MIAVAEQCDSGTLLCWNFWGKDCNQGTPSGWVWF